MSNRHLLLAVCWAWSLASPPMNLRPAGRDDLPEICALIRELAAFERLAEQVAFNSDLVAEHLFGPAAVAHVLLAEVDEGVAGMALWFPTFSTFLGRPGIWLEDLFVRPAFRGRGIGRALMVRLRSMTEGRVEWSVLDWNQSAIELYQNLGARPIEGWTTYRWSPESDWPSTPT